MDERLFNTLIQQPGPPPIQYVPPYVTIARSATHQILCNADKNIPKDNSGYMNNFTSSENKISQEKTRNQDSVGNNGSDAVAAREQLDSIYGTPVYFLNLLLDDFVISWLTVECNTNGSQMRNFQTVTKDELQCFIAILYLSGYLEIPRRRMLWERSPDMHCPLVSAAISRDRFEQIFTALNMGDNTKDDTVQIFNLTSFLNLLNDRFMKHAPREEQHNIAECKIMIGTRHTQQYAINNSNRIHGRNVHIWCGCTRSAYCCWVKHCSVGKDNHMQAREIIVEYATELQRKCPGRYNLLFEKHFGDVATLCDLQCLGISGSGAERDKSSSVVNSALDGVDKMESNVNLYRISIRGRKGYSALFTYLLDIVMQNAWQLYRSSQPNDKKQLDLLSFRRNIVIYYLKHYARPVRLYRGSKGIQTVRYIQNKRKKSAVQSDTRYDGLRHWVIPQSKQTRCAHCSTKTTTRCQKCDIGLHVKCFMDYHQKPKDVGKA